jgi:hypothetical protein
MFRAQVEGRQDRLGPLSEIDSSAKPLYLRQLRGMLLLRVEDRCGGEVKELD